MGMCYGIDAHFANVRASESHLGVQVGSEENWVEMGPGAVTYYTAFARQASDVTIGSRVQNMMPETPVGVDCPACKSTLPLSYHDHD